MQRSVFWRTSRGNHRTSVALVICGVVGVLMFATTRTAWGQTEARIDALLAPFPAPPRLQTDDDRLARLTAWLGAVAEHQPGQIDAALRRAADWRFADLQGLAIDTTNLALLMRNQRLGAFNYETDGLRTRIVYTPSQLDLLRVLACAAGGYITPTLAVDRRLASVAPCLQAGPRLPLEGAVANARFASERLRRNGDDNQVLFRAAILHADVAMLSPPIIAADDVTTLPVGPRTVRLEIVDGQVTGLNLAALHWHIADRLLDYTRPASEEEPAPGRDDRVRDWYRTTSLWMHSEKQYDDEHTEHARRLFPRDAPLLFLLGCQHEAYASPMMAPGLRLARMTLRNQLQTADRYFAEALSRDPGMGQAGLRRGRVLNLLGRYAESAELLNEVGRILPEAPPLRYFWNMFLGEAEEGLEHYDLARAAFDRASTLFPSAQKPRLALSQLEWRRDGRAAALEPMTELFGQGRDTDVSDPWSSYFASHAEDAEFQIGAFWRQLTGPVE